MPTLLSDPPTSLYAVLLVALFVCAAFAFKLRTQRSYWVAIAALSAFLGLLALDAIFESPREEATRRTVYLAMAINQQNKDRFVEQLSTNFSMRGKSRSDMRNSPFWQLAQQHKIAVQVHGFSREDCTMPDANTVEIGFLATGSAPGGQKMIWQAVATYERTADGFRARGFRFYDMIDQARKQEVTMPGDQ
jgi:hypothetical protein